MACGLSVPHRPSVGFPAAAGNELWLFGYVRLELRTLLRSPLEHEKIAMIDAADIAAVAAATLGQPQHYRRRYWLSGPNAVSFLEIAVHLTSIIEQTIDYEKVSDAWLRDRQLGAGTPKWRVDLVAEFNAAFRRGDGAHVSDTVVQLTGREPCSITAFLARHREQFQS